jgi:hypothetical protein
LEQASPFVDRPPKRTIADVLLVFQNVGMERFAVWRHAFAVRTKESSSPHTVPGKVPFEPDREGTPEGRFGGVVVLLIPVGAVAWVAIGWLVYALLT